MKKYILPSLLLCCILIFGSCSKSTPENYLNLAVINANVVEGFASNALSMELQNPAAKTGVRTVMTRQEIIKAKIRSSKKLLHDLERMNETPDTHDILSSSIALHEFVIEVYETDYMKLARLYDEGAPAETITAFDNSIKDKYTSMFELHYENLIRGGKLYAEKHNIKIR